ncbi:hypothetical protein AAMO2058_000153800 [Amorphochlora amoebiformis]
MADSRAKLVGGMEQRPARLGKCLVGRRRAVDTGKVWVYPQSCGSVLVATVVFVGMLSLLPLALQQGGFSAEVLGKQGPRSGSKSGKRKGGWGRQNQCPNVKFQGQKVPTKLLKQFKKMWGSSSHDFLIRGDSMIEHTRMMSSNPPRYMQPNHPKLKSTRENLRRKIRAMRHELVKEVEQGVVITRYMRGEEDVATGDGGMGGSKSGTRKPSRFGKGEREADDREMADDDME